MNHGELLQKLILEDKKIPTSVYLNIMKDKANYSANTARGYINPKTKTIEPRPLFIISTLFGIDMADFGYRPDLYVTQYSDVPSGEVYSYSGVNEEAGNGQSFVHHYFQAVTNYLLSTDESLLVTDYVAKIYGLGNSYPQTYYSNLDKEYFEKIEARISEKQLLYTRLIQLPLDNQAKTMQEGLMMLVEMLSDVTFLHLCRCLFYHEPLCKFLLVLKPFRLHSYYVSDKKVVLTEYFRYDKNGRPVPDTLFVNKLDFRNSNSVGSRYIKMCLEEFERMLTVPSIRNMKITYTALVQALVALERQVSAEIEGIKQHPNYNKSVFQTAYQTYQQEQIRYEDFQQTFQDNQAERLFHLENLHRGLCNKMKISAEISVSAIT